MVEVRQPIFFEKPYFNELVEFFDEGIEVFLTKLDEDQDRESQRRLSHAAYMYQRDGFIARYTRGDALDELSREFPKMIESLKRYIDCSERVFSDGVADQYIDILWVFSFAYFFGISPEDFAHLKARLPFIGQDQLLDTIIRLIDPQHPVSEQVLFPKTYSPLVQALDGTEPGPCVQVFLKNYYRTLRSAYWHDLHKYPDSGYFGYWSFELAALVKGLGWDDSSFAHNMYYPRDLAHFTPRGLITADA